MSATPESVWDYLQEVGRKLEKVGEKLEKVGEELDKVGEEIRELKELAKETDRRFKETDRRFKETDKKIKELSSLFTTQWGKLVEALVEPGAVNLFRERGIKVRYSSRRIEVEDEKGRVIAEFDIFLQNDEELVVIEVKTIMKKEDVDEFLEKLSKIKEWIPTLKGYKIYGAVAGINYEEGVDRYAYRRGLFVLKSEGGIIRIANDENFKPKVW